MWHTTCCTAAPSLLISSIDQISETERGKGREEKSGREKGDKISSHCQYLKKKKGDKTHMSHLNLLIHFLVLRKREERLKEMESKDLKREEREFSAEKSYKIDNKHAKFSFFELQQ
jgi:hypothetical protein